ncbi:hypothetical protein [Prescottella agglutinans]|uniref:Phage-related tail protein n=1 Tax=Prescottella agglutinans TaxID=1644129 RepID=A0ABT6MIA2_9NOCA|nr:hypothetical protein [Prescottella agglutinans]MDH6284042.1 phage-related tail protein [Prescottella agglutinans]
MYSEEFSVAMESAYGLHVSSELVPALDAVESDLQALGDWLATLEEDAHAAIDEVTAENGVMAGLADASVSIVTNIGALLEVFDTQPESISVSTALEMLTAASTEAVAKEPNG